MSARSDSVEQSMAMQQWMGPRAHSNRYEAWDSGAETAQVILFITIKLDLLSSNVNYCVYTVYTRPKTLEKLVFARSEFQYDINVRDSIRINQILA